MDLLVCEDVRIETHGKLTLTGFYPARKIVVQQGDPRPDGEPAAALEVISLLLIAQGGHGSFAGRIVLFNPDGSQALEASLGNVELVAEGTGSIIGKLRPFVVKAFGTHRLTLWLDDRSYDQSFDIMAGQLQAEAAA